MQDLLVLYSSFSVLVMVYYRSPACSYEAELLCPLKQRLTSLLAQKQHPDSSWLAFYVIPNQRVLPSCFMINSTLQQSHMREEAPHGGAPILLLPSLLAQLE